MPNILEPKDSMIIITEIKTITVDRNQWMFSKTLDPSNEFIAFDENNDPTITSVSTLNELIRGRRFIRQDGSEIILGYSKEIAETIGIEFEAWTVMKKFQEELYNKNIFYAKAIKTQASKLNEITRLSQKRDMLLANLLNRIINATLSQRLKYLFRF